MSEQNQKTETHTEEELQEMDDLLVEGDNLIEKLKEKELVVDFITEAALNLLSLAEYDMIIDRMQHNRFLHEEIED